MSYFMRMFNNYPAGELLLKILISVCCTNLFVMSIKITWGVCASTLLNAQNWHVSFHVQILYIEKYAC